MKLVKALGRILYNLVSWYYVSFFVHVISTFKGEQIHILKCLQYVAQIYGGIYLILWTFVNMLVALRNKLGILVLFRKPIRKRRLRFPIVVSKV